MKSLTTYFSLEGGAKTLLKCWILQSNKLILCHVNKLCKYAESHTIYRGFFNKRRVSTEVAFSGSNCNLRSVTISMLNDNVRFEFTDSHPFPTDSNFQTNYW